jgi:type IV pilus assembly protein PilE
MPNIRIVMKRGTYAMERQNGFTLIEVMVVVAIVAILAAIAVPNYSEYVRRGKLVEAPSTLADLRVKLEQNFQDNRTYKDTTTAGRLGNCGVQTPKGTQYFGWSCVATDTTYTITAANLANVGLDDAGDYTYTLDGSNARKTTVFDGNACTAAKWVTKKGDGC